jgi:hypothetical protein
MARRTHSMRIGMRDNQDGTDSYFSWRLLAELLPPRYLSGPPISDTHRGLVSDQNRQRSEPSSIRQLVGHKIQTPHLVGCCRPKTFPLLSRGSNWVISTVASGKLAGIFGSPGRALRDFGACCVHIGGAVELNTESAKDPKRWADVGSHPSKNERWGTRPRAVEYRGPSLRSG